MVVIPLAKPLSVKIQGEDSARKLQVQLNELTSGLDARIDRIFKENEAWATAWMKLNAPWTDNTGKARAGLHATSSGGGHSHEMEIAYSRDAPYGKWLELANSGRFQILGPAMRYIARKLLKDFAQIWKNTPNAGLPAGRDIPPQARKVARKGTANKSGSRRSRKAYGRRQNNR